MSTAAHVRKLVHRQYDRVWLPDSLYTQYVNEMERCPMKTVKRKTFMNALAAHPDIESITEAGQGCTKNIIGYRAIRHYQAPMSHLYDALATMSRRDRYIAVAITFTILALAVVGANSLLGGGV